MTGLIKYLVVVVLTLGYFFVGAQEFGSNAKNTSQEETTIDPEANRDGYEPALAENKGFKPDVSVSLGSSFSSWSPGFNTFSSWVMPEFTFPVNKRFAVKAGIGYSNMFFTSPGNEGNVFQQNNAQFGHVYVSGIYRVTDRFTVAGTAYKTFEVAPPQNEVNPRALDLSNEGIMINLDYRVSENVRINAAFSYQKYNPYGGFMDPGGFYGQPSPFGGQPSPFFSPAFGPGF
jgi:hypothetical protein